MAGTYMTVSVSLPDHLIPARTASSDGFHAYSIVAGWHVQRCSSCANLISVLANSPSCPRHCSKSSRGGGGGGRAAETGGVRLRSTSFLGDENTLRKPPPVRELTDLVGDAGAGGGGGGGAKRCSLRSSFLGTASSTLNARSGVQIL